MRPSSSRFDRFRFEEVLQMVLRSEITDSMTIIAVLHVARLRASSGHSIGICLTVLNDVVDGWRPDHLAG